MTKAGYAIVAVLALAATAVRGDWPDGSPCELQWADRTQTSSTSCLSCHDGSIGPAISFTHGVTGSPDTHPVEVDYGATYASQPKTYQSTTALPNEITLVDGKVSCTSCHDGRSAEPRHVALSQANLCTACHNL